jgi:glycosyltransferase involved in cell wall biosynthesis
MGRPVIASAVDGIREIITPEQDGLLVPAGDVSALAEAMRRLLRDRELAQKLATAGQERIVQAFSIEQMARKLERLYETLTRAS